MNPPNQGSATTPQSGGWTRDRGLATNERTRRVTGTPLQRIGSRHTLDSTEGPVSPRETELDSTSQPTSPKSPPPQPQYGLYSPNTNTNATQNRARSDKSAPTDFSKVVVSDAPLHANLQAQRTSELTSSNPSQTALHSPRDDRRKAERKESTFFGKVLKKTIAPMISSNPKSKRQTNESYEEGHVQGEQERIEQGIRAIKANLDQLEERFPLGRRERVQAIGGTKTAESTPTISASNKPKTQSAELDERRHNIVKEILYSEESYIKQIQSAVKDYYHPLQDAIKQGQIPVKVDYLSNLFESLQSLVPLNVGLHSELKARIGAWTPTSTIGEIFVKFTPFLKMYTAYSNIYDSAISKVHEVATQEWFVKLCPAVVLLESLLISPVQRIPRYTLLLTDLYNNTMEDHPDDKLLLKALAMMKNVATHVNQQISHTKYSDKMQNEGLLFLLAPNRTIVMDEILSVAAEKSLYIGAKEARAFLGKEKQKMACILFNDIFVKYGGDALKKKTKDRNDVHQWPLELSWVDKKNNAVVIDFVGPCVSFTLSCSSLEIAERWYAGLTQAIAARLKETQPHNLNSEERNGCYTFDGNRYEYDGKWVNGKMHGYGQMVVKGLADHHAIYTGFFADNIEDGEGCMRFLDGHVYTGQLEKGLKNGVGLLEYGRDRFYGEWTDGRRQGQGSVVYGSRDTYIGQWDRDNRNGAGKLTHTSGTSYIGRWVNGLMDGEGVLLTPTEEYTGSFQSGLKNGFGVLRSLKTTTLYEGQWKNGDKHGQGKLTNTLGVYEGEFEKDAKKGRGVMLYADGSRYEGHWANNQRHDKGYYESRSGSFVSYDGEWVYGLKSGKGRMAFADGSYYDGNFADDLMHGAGTLIYPEIGRAHV